MCAKSKSIYNVLTRWRDFRLKLLFEGILIGLLSGILVVMFRLLLEKAELLREKLYALMHVTSPLLTVMWFIALVLISYILSFIVRKEPMAGGSGIPQVKGILMGKLKMNWLRVIIGKFIGGVMAIGAGLSLGREGPSVQLGAAVGQGVSRLLGRLRIEEKYLITCGSSAGLAAAFNAPLAGAIFALEELHKNFSPVVLTSAVAASLTADLVTQQFFGQKPIFDFSILPTLPIKYYFYLISLGVIIGILGVVFNWFLIRTLQIYSKLTWLPDQLKPAIPLLAGGILGFVLPEALGGGNNLINALGQVRYSLLMLVLLLVVKFLFTMVSYGSGVPGGIFLPMLVIGALAGDIYGNVVVQYLHMNPQYIGNFVVFAMAAYFTSVVKAPVTGSILIMEMTGSFSHLFALVTVSMTAYIVSDVLKSKPVYDILLERSLKRRKMAVDLPEDSNKCISEISVCVGSTLSGKRIKDIEWPPHCLLVGIRRGEAELIPRGDTRIYSGDCLIVLSDDSHVMQIRSTLYLITGNVTI